MTTTDFASTDREMAERVRSYAGHIEDMGEEERVLLLGYLSTAVLRLLGRQATLGETKPGDVFYLANEPGLVWHRHAVNGAETYDFTRLDGEAWWSLNGIGMSDQAVTVVHNTKKEPT
jgi:hypothetical protein